MSFQLLAPDELERVRTLLETKLPATAMVLNIVDLVLKENYPKDRVKIYGFKKDGGGGGDGDSSDVTTESDEKDPPESDLFLVIITTDKHNHEYSEYSTIYSPTKPSNMMMESFSKLYDWNKQNLFASILLPFKPYLEGVGTEKGGTFGGGPCTDFYFPREEASALNINSVSPDGQFELDQLSPEHAPKVNSHWKYGDSSETGNARLADDIQTFGGTGVFRKGTGTSSSPKSSDDLVSWILGTRIGSLGALHTVEEYRRRGLARWTMEAASKGMAADQGLIPICEVEDYNKESRSLVEKVGFKVIHDVYWMIYMPPPQSSSKTPQ